MLKYYKALAVIAITGLTVTGLIMYAFPEPWLAVGTQEDGYAIEIWCEQEHRWAEPSCENYYVFDNDEYVDWRELVQP